MGPIAKHLKKHFICKQCSDCCKTGVVVDLKQALKIIDKCGGQMHHLKKNKDFPSGFSVETSYDSDKCLYLKRNKCTIYKHRPRYCGEFPLEDGKVSQEVDLCPQLDSKGRHKKKKKNV